MLFSSLLIIYIKIWFSARSARRSQLIANNGHLLGPFPKFKHFTINDNELIYHPSIISIKSTHVHDVSRFDLSFQFFLCPFIPFFLFTFRAMDCCNVYILWSISLMQSICLGIICWSHHPLDTIFFSHLSHSSYDLWTPCLVQTAITLVLLNRNIKVNTSLKVLYL